MSADNLAVAQYAERDQTSHTALGDVFVALALALAAFCVYLQTMPPSVLDGDSGRWQYIGQVLGVSYPTGSPLLTLLGKLWTLLIPVGTVAYRINLMSVAFGAVAIGLAYLLFHNLVVERSAAVLGAMLFATLPTTWWWSITIKTYALNLIFVSVSFLLLLRWSETRKEGTLRWFAIVYGLSLTNHSTMSLFAPAFAVFILLRDRSILRSPRRLGALFACFGLPFLIVCLYIPIRGAMLWMSQGVEPGLPWPVSVSHGLVSSEYYPSFRGFLDFILATQYTQSLVSSWVEVPHRLVTVYAELFSHEFAWLYVPLGIIGGLYLLMKDFKKAMPILLGYLAFPPLVVQYGQGMQAAFLLPCNLMVVVGIASAIAGILEGLRFLARKMDSALGRFFVGPISHLLVVSVFVLLIATGAISRYAKMDRSEDFAVQNYWTRILQHPLEEKAGILAHSGVLVPLWYFQSVEGRRPDLLGVFPPDDQIAQRWLETGHTLYLAGPLDGWLPKAWEQYRLTPWGILVKIALHDSPDEIDMIGPEKRTQVDFGGRLELVGYDLPETVSPSSTLPLRLYWQTTSYCSADYLVSLRLVDGLGRNVSAVEDRLVSAWYPERGVPEGRLVLDVYDLPVPVGLLPGQYEVQLVVHNPDTGDSLSPVGKLSPFPLDRVTVGELQRRTVEPSGFDHAVDARFGDALKLVGYSVHPNEVTVGQGMTVESLWQAAKTPTGNHTFQVQWVDTAGVVREQNVVRSAYPDYPISHWKAEKFVRDWLVLNAPAELRPGEYTLHLGVSDENGGLVSIWRGWRPMGEWLPLGTIKVLDRARQFEMPSAAFRSEVNFSDLVELIGYDLEPSVLKAGGSLSLTLYWKALQVMDTSYTVFVHLVDPNGRILTQSDAIPASGTLPTSGWLSGEVVTDHHDLEIGERRLAGEYSIVVGLYDAWEGTRLHTLPDNDDHVRLTILQYDAELQ